MRSIRAGIAALILFGFAMAKTSAADSPRKVVDLNPGWKFIKEDAADAQNVATDDSGWQNVNLPHTWNNLDGEDGGNNYYRGVGWYRRHLKADPAWEGKAIYIKFDAACIDAAVYVNRRQVGTHSGAFGAFCFGITGMLKPNTDNVIAVRVDNSKDPNVAPLSGDFTMFGGIYRGVHLIVTNPLAISPVDDASSGVYVRQDKVTQERASLHVTVVPKFAGDMTRIPGFALKCELLDADGKVVTEARQEHALVTNPVAVDLNVEHPHLWNARKDPYLYTMRATMMDEQKAVTDVVEQPIGLRFFRVDPEKGFFLNGRPYRLLGVNRHQDHLDEGWAISLADHQNDFANMMEMGCTGVRLSHYQHAQEFYDLCDHGGIVAWAEIPLVNQVSLAPEFDANAQQQLRELIKQSFNHPAICFWSLSNEQRGSNGKSEAAKEMSDHEIELTKKLNAEAHELDPTRLTTEASAIQPGKPQDAITDVVGFNRYHGWYGGKPTELAADLDKIHGIYPDRGVALSEYGAGAAVTQHEFPVKQPKPNGSRWHPEEWQCIVHEDAWAAIKPRNWIWGTFIWCEHDFGVDSRNEGDHAGRNDKGMTTYDGKTRKDAFYFYKANWSDEPMVYITERRFSPRPVADAPVKLYSNCDSVELSLNGKSLGTVPGSDIHVFIWDKVQLQTGENKLEATGTRDGKTYTDACTIVYDTNATDGHRPATQPAK